MKDHADHFTTISDQFCRACLLQRMARHHQFPPRRLIESANQAEEGALAGAAVTPEDHEMTGRDCKVDVSDPDHLAGSQGIDPRQTFCQDERLIGGTGHMQQTPGKME